MAIDFLVRPLLQVPIFRTLKPLQITEIARRADRMIYNPGDYIISNGAPADAAILIVSGDAVRVDGLDHGRPAEAIVTGSLLAEMAMLIETEHSATVLARTPVKALRLTRADMLRQMSEDPSLAAHFVEQISGRLNRLAEELRSVDSRLSGQSASPLPAPQKMAQNRSQQHQGHYH